MIAIVSLWGTAAAQEATEPTEAAEPTETAEAAEPTEVVAPAPGAEPQSLRRWGIDIQVGSLANTDPAWDVFGGEQAMLSFGFSGSARVHHNLSIVAAWHHVRQGAILVPSQGTDSETDAGSGLESFAAAYFGNEFSAGLRGDVPIQDTFFPFLKAQGLAMASLVKFDDNTDVNNPEGEASFTGVSPGFLVTAGVEVRIPPQVPVQVGLELELGYGWLATTDLDDLGEMTPGGFCVRSGVGMRF
jgi:hypothetical protein